MRTLIFNCSISVAFLGDFREGGFLKTGRNLVLLNLSLQAQSASFRRVSLHICCQAEGSHVQRQQQFWYFKIWLQVWYSMKNLVRHFGSTEFNKNMNGIPVSIYEPLPTDGHIRVLTLRPGETDEEIECRCEAVHLEDGKYTAISYVWGDANSRVQITCNEQKVTITANLAAALFAMRHETTPQTVWADAICIDQKNEREKEKQVKQMGQIYEQAERVIVWLAGDENGWAKTCLETIQEVNKYMSELWYEHGSTDEIPSFTEPYPQWIETVRTSKIQQLLDFPWFQRVWVVQEAALARECLLLWGKEEMDMIELVEFALFLKEKSDLQLATGIRAEKLAELFSDVHTGYKNSETWRDGKELAEYYCSEVEDQDLLFTEVLAVSSKLSATKARDHIYAFLGHPSAKFPDGKLLIEPNYNEEYDICRIHIDLSCTLLQHPREAQYVLSAVVHESKEDLIATNVPSWVPRWDGHRGVASPMANPTYWYRVSGGYDESGALF